MGLFSKKKATVGSIESIDGSNRRFRWRIPNMREVKFGSTLESDELTNYTGAKFHMHFYMGNTGTVGFAMHYKKPPVPKFSHYFVNSRGAVMRQCTVSTTPEDTERSGHWNICSQKDLLTFLGFEDTLTVCLTIDDDRLIVRKIPDTNLAAILWTIPDFRLQNTYPFTSIGFTIDGTALVCYIEARMKASLVQPRIEGDCIEGYYFSLFTYSGKMPQYTIEMVDGAGEVYATQEPTGAAKQKTVLYLPRSELVQHIGKDDAVFINFGLEVDDDPLTNLRLGGRAGSRGGSIIMDRASSAQA